MARLVGLLYGGESASVLGCLCDGTGTLSLPPVLRGMTVTPSQFVCSGEAPVLRAVYLNMSTAAETK